MLTLDKPQAVGLDPRRWQFALDLARDYCEQDAIPSIGLIVGRSGKTTGPHLFGRQHLPPDSAPLRDDAIFLIASITKPIVATAALLLIEQGKLTLGDRVRDLIPEFAGTGRHGITVRHLLTHTSGLPDMLPDNEELRKAHAPLATFIKDICQLTPDFPPGRGVQYQSMGFALLGEIIGRVSGKSCPLFLRDELFLPLEMHDTSLGAPDDWFEESNPKADRIAHIRPPDENAGGEDWDWNSRYWRSFAAPWGGLLTTPADLARFAQMLLNRGRVGNRQLLSPAGIAAATRNQLAEMPELPEDQRRSRPWGLGWKLHWPAYSANFGDLLGPNSYGHWGATGTILWLDPDRETFAILLTTQPQEPQGKYLARLTNVIAAALV